MNSLPLNLVHSNVQTMSSREIAELCGKKHKNVIRDIREMLHNLDGSILNHEQYQELKDERGYTAEFLLNKTLTMTLVTGYDVNIRYRINRRWQELENQVAQNTITTTDPLSSIANNMQVLADGMQVLAQASQTTMAKLDHTERYINLLELNQKGHIKITREVAQQVKEYKAQGYSQASIARLLRISPTSVNLIVHDKYNFAELPSDDHVTRMLETAKQLTLTVEQENNHE